VALALSWWQNAEADLIANNKAVPLDALSQFWTIKLLRMHHDLFGTIINAVLLDSPSELTDLVPPLDRPPSMTHVEVLPRVQKKPTAVCSPESADPANQDGSASRSAALAAAHSKSPVWNTSFAMVTAKTT
jgi:hypothetical protein